MVKIQFYCALRGIHVYNHLPWAGEKVYITYDSDSPYDCALAVIRRTKEHGDILMGHVGKEHAREFTTLLAFCGVREITGRLPTDSVQYSPRAGGIESQLIININSFNESLIDHFQNLEQYIVGM